MKEIKYDDEEFRATTTQWINAQVPFTIRVDGVRGKLLQKLLPPAIGITGATVALVTFLAAFGSLAAIALYAISQGYDVEGEATKKGYKFKARKKPRAVD